MGGGGYGGGMETTMSMISDDASQVRSGAMSPTRSVMSFSGVSAYGRGSHHVAAPSKAPDEPPFVYGHYNPDAFFGEIAMSFAGQGSQRLRPASVRALGEYSCFQDTQARGCEEALANLREWQSCYTLAKT
jgi:hypothetical protein